jgi:hypothetical protein
MLLSLLEAPAAPYKDSISACDCATHVFGEQAALRTSAAHLCEHVVDHTGVKRANGLHFLEREESSPRRRLPNPDCNLLRKQEISQTHLPKTQPVSNPDGVLMPVP